MRKILSSILLSVILISCALTAHAEVPNLSENMFTYAKGALVCLSTGDFDKLVTKLPFSDVSPSTKEWGSFARGSFSSLEDGVQTKYAVAYWSGRAWKIAVPVSTPDSGSVESLVLLSEDGDTFTGYGCALWSDVEAEYRRSEYVSWNEEYISSSSVIIEMDAL